MHEARMKRDHGQLKAISKSYSDAIETAEIAREEVRVQSHLEQKSVEKKTDLEKMTKLDAFETDALTEEETQESLSMNRPR
jgi:hypothetical protein